MFLILLWVVYLLLYHTRLNGCSLEPSLVVTTLTPCSLTGTTLSISFHCTYLWLLWMALSVHGIWSMQHEASTLILMHYTALMHDASEGHPEIAEYIRRWQQLASIRLTNALVVHMMARLWYSTGCQNIEFLGNKNDELWDCGERKSDDKRRGAHYLQNSAFPWIEMVPRPRVGFRQSTLTKCEGLQSPKPDIKSIQGIRTSREKMLAEALLCK